MIEQEDKTMTAEESPTGRTVEILWDSSTKATLSEAFSTGMQFCLIDDTNHQCSTWMHCKDYFQDAIHGCLNKKHNSIYGFSYKPDQAYHPSIKMARFLIGNSGDAKFSENVPALLDFLHQIESELKIPATKAIRCSNPPVKYKKGGVFLILGSKRWIRSPVMVSLYTLLVRVGLGHTIGKPFRETLEATKSGKSYCREDVSRVQSGLAGIERILKEGDLVIFGKSIHNNYPKDLSVGMLHNDSGIVAFSSGRTESQFPQWHGKPEIKKAKKKKEK